MGDSIESIRRLHTAQPNNHRHSPNRAGAWSPHTEDTRHEASQRAELRPGRLGRASRTERLQSPAIRTADRGGCVAPLSGYSLAPREAEETESISLLGADAVADGFFQLVGVGDDEDAVELNGGESASLLSRSATPLDRVKHHIG